LINLPDTNRERVKERNPARENKVETAHKPRLAPPHHFFVLNISKTKKNPVIPKIHIFYQTFQKPPIRLGLMDYSRERQRVTPNLPQKTKGSKFIHIIGHRR